MTGRPDGAPPRRDYIRPGRASGVGWGRRRPRRSPTRRCPQIHPRPHGRHGAVRRVERVGARPRGLGVRRPGRLALAGRRQHSKLHEINPYTGALKRTIGDQAFLEARRLGGTEQAGYWRDRDLESIAYDGGGESTPSRDPAPQRTDLPDRLPRLKRDRSGNFQVHSFQPLPSAASSPAPRGTRRTGRCTSGSGDSYELRHEHRGCDVPGAHLATNPPPGLTERQRPLRHPRPRAR